MLSLAARIIGAGARLFIPLSIVAGNIAAGAAAAHEAPRYHINPKAAFIGGFAAGFLDDWLFFRMFGTASPLMSVAFVGAAYSTYHALLNRHEMYQERGFRQRYYRATISPFSVSYEPSQRAAEAMVRGLQAIRGYRSFFGNEAAIMAARYARG